MIQDSINSNNNFEKKLIKKTVFDDVTAEDNGYGIEIRLRIS